MKKKLLQLVNMLDEEKDNGILKIIHTIVKTLIKEHKETHSK